MSKDFGGNTVEIWDQKKDELRFATTPYTYFLKKLSVGQEYRIADLKSYTVYLLDCASSSILNVCGKDIELNKGDALQVENVSISVAAVWGPVTILVAGVTSVLKTPSLTVTRADNLKKVVKPWGHELWINGEHPGYALKQIYIHGPHKTSLQYHNFKQETNVLFDGQAKLHYKSNSEAANDCVTSDDIETVAIRPLSSVSVTPEILHRIEALNNVVLYEVSTPHLDDVIRVWDDTDRPHGRIKAEHTQVA